jgi:hypothetical protein
MSEAVFRSLDQIAQLLAESLQDAGYAMVTAAGIGALDVTAVVVLVRADGPGRASRDYLPNWKFCGTNPGDKK